MSTLASTLQRKYTSYHQSMPTAEEYMPASHTPHIHVLKRVQYDTIYCTHVHFLITATPSQAVGKLRSARDNCL